MGYSRLSTDGRHRPLARCRALAYAGAEMMSPQKKKKLIQLFEELYPDPKTELNFSNEYQLLISVVLSAQSTDRKVNEITPALFKRFPNFKQLSAGPLSDIEEIIRPINYYKTKAKHLLALSSLVCKSFKGKLPRTHEELISLPGVGNKTANVVLSELKIAPAFPVDTHVFRVSRRLGLAGAATPEKVEAELKKQFAADLWNPMHHWLILHGRRVCKAPNPLCAECGVANLCPSKR